MKELLILVLLAAAGWFAYDDYYKQRPALKQAQEETQRLTAELNQPRASSNRLYLQPARTPAVPTWFRERLNARPAMDEPVRQTGTPAQYPTP
jgi:hypothetical protein